MGGHGGLGQPAPWITRRPGAHANIERIFRNQRRTVAKSSALAARSAPIARDPRLRVAAGLWDSDNVFRTNKPVSMRLPSSIVRILMKGGGLALLWLLVPSTVSAAPAPRRVPGRVCDPYAIRLRRLPRVPKSYGGPVVQPSTRAQAGLSDVLVRLQRFIPASVNDDDAAIQNDAPAAWFDAAERPSPALAPLGVLVRAGVHHPNTHTFSPRSPRGPPVGRLTVFFTQSRIRQIEVTRCESFSQT
jgi:hypothetical protein